VDLDEILRGGDYIDGDLDTMFLSHRFNHSKMVDIQNFEVDAIPSPFSLAE
jgi:hypothetical protein